MKAQRVQLMQAFIKLAPDVTAKDRTDCAKKLKVSKQIICYYLAGKVSNNDKAIQILEFLKNRIETRQNEIEQLWKS